MSYIIEAKGIKKTYVNGDIETPVLKGIDIQVREGEFLAIMGRSGAGKSTLLFQLSLLDNPSAGEILVDKTDILNLSRMDKTLFRLRNMGYVFQDYALVPELNAVENVSVPLIMQGYPISQAYKESEKVLSSLGFDRQINNLPSQLSGGEQQRVVIARALINEPLILFADEPTGNLDPYVSDGIINLFNKINNAGTSVLMATHNYNIIKNYPARVLKCQNRTIMDSNKENFELSNEW